MPDLSHKYLRVQDLSAYQHMVFAARRPVVGRYAGRHASRQRGQNVEFNDYRAYAPGDEVGDIDWKAYARSDRLFVKLFEHQSDMSVHLVVDASASMDFRGVEGRRSKVESRRSEAPDPRPSGLDPRHSTGSLPDSKYDHACRMAAAIAFLTTRQRDRVSFTLARGGVGAFLPPVGTPSHVRSILEMMERGPGAGAAGLSEAIDALARRVPRRGLLVVFGDLLDDAAPILGAMDRFAHGGGRVIVFHVLHPDELDLPDLGGAVFRDSESGRALAVDTDDLREAYARRVRAFLDGWASACHGRGFEHHAAPTSAPYHQPLERFLFHRAGAA